LQEKKKGPYLRRHEFATEFAPKRSDLTFNQLMGHSTASKMRQVYVKELGNEGMREHLIEKGLITREETMSPAQVRLKAKYCPICKEPNKHDALFCFKCGFTISNEGVWQVREEERKTVRELEETKKELEKLKEKQKSFDEFIKNIGKKMDEELKRKYEKMSQEEIDRVEKAAKEFERAIFSTEEETKKKEREEE
jgi:hypothetical protein